LPPKCKINYDFPCGLLPAKNLKLSFLLPLFGEAGGRGGRGEFRPPSLLIKSVRIFSNTHPDIYWTIILHRLWYNKSKERGSNEKTHKWIKFYNTERIHGSIGDITPAEAMEKYKRGEVLNIETISM